MQTEKEEDVFEIKDIVFDKCMKREIKNPAASYFSHDLSNHSIIGLEGLNFRVRDGNGCFPFGIATGN
jgi:hypothetical protein